MTGKAKTNNDKAITRPHRSNATHSARSYQKTVSELTIEEEYYTESESDDELNSINKKKNFKQVQPPISDVENESSDVYIVNNQNSEQYTDHTNSGTDIEDPKFTPQPPSCSLSSSTTPESSPRQSKSKNSFQSNSSKHKGKPKNNDKSENTISESYSLRSVNSIKPRGSASKYAVQESDSDDNNDQNSDQENENEEKTKPKSSMGDSRSVKSNMSNGSRKFSAQQMMKFIDPIKENSDDENKPKVNTSPSKLRKITKINKKMKFAQDKDPSEKFDRKQRSKYLQDLSDDDYVPPKAIGGEYNSSIEVVNRYKAEDSSLQSKSPSKKNSNKSESLSVGVYMFNKPKDRFASDDDEKSDTSRARNLKNHKFLNEDDNTPYYSKNMSNQQKLNKILAKARGETKTIIKDEDVSFLDRQNVVIKEVTEEQKPEEENKSKVEEEKDFNMEEEEEQKDSSSFSLDTELKQVMQPRSHYLKNDFSQIEEKPPAIFTMKNKRRIPQRRVIKVEETSEEAYQRLLVQKTTNRAVPSPNGIYYERTTRGRIDYDDISPSELELKRQEEEERLRKQRELEEKERLRREKEKIKLGIISTSSEDQNDEDMVLDRDIGALQDNLSAISEDSSVRRRREEIEKLAIDSTISSESNRQYGREKRLYLDEDDDDYRKRRNYPNYEDDPVDDERIYAHKQKKVVKVVKKDFDDDSPRKGEKSESSSRSKSKNKYSNVSSSDNDV